MKIRINEEIQLQCQRLTKVMIEASRNVAFLLE